MDKRLSGPPYLYDGVNRERGGSITRQTLVKQDPMAGHDWSKPIPASMRSHESCAGEPIADADGAAFRKHL